MKNLEKVHFWKTRNIKNIVIFVCIIGYYHVVFKV